jgi:phage shock protein PspC (stress-responsive transcriptional regulator)
MHKVIAVSLTGRTELYRFHEDAYDRLSHYLDQARFGLSGDPDQGEVISDLEGSIGEKITERLGLGDRFVTLADIDAVLDVVGPVADPTPAGITGRAARATGRPLKRRRLARIREGQEIAGVCTGLAAYSEIGVDWVRTIFVFATLLTVGGFLIVYLGMAFLLPVYATRGEWLAAQLEAEAAAGH